MQILIHLGAPKVGSSAIQVALTRYAGALANVGINYVASYEDQWVSGSAVTHLRLESDHGYLSGGPLLTKIAQGDVASARSLSNFLSRMGGHLTVISDETLVCEKGFADGFRSTDPFKNYDVELLLYVRPPVAWIESAWWQWGIWSDNQNGFESFVEEFLGEERRNTPPFWGQIAANWEHAIAPTKFDIRVGGGPSGPDVVSDIFDLLRTNWKISDMSNPRTPSSVIGALQEYPWLRAGPHDSGMEFTLSRLAPTSFATLESPIARMPQSLGKAVVRKFAEDRDFLLSRMGPEDQQRVRSDPRWWVYSGPSETGLSHPADNPLQAVFLEALMSIDRRLRRLENTAE